MKQFLMIAALLALSSAPAAATDPAYDDGGFGTQRFSNQAPSALGDDPASTAPSALASDAAAVADVEPASGDEQTPDDPRDPEAIADEPETGEAVSAETPDVQQ